MLTYFDVDVDCATCFNHMVDQLRAVDTVQAVEADAAIGCLVVRHEVAEADLAAVILSAGHTVDVAANGEILMGEAHPIALRACQHTT